MLCTVAFTFGSTKLVLGSATYITKQNKAIKLKKRSTMFVSKSLGFMFIFMSVDSLCGESYAN